MRFVFFVSFCVMILFFRLLPLLCHSSSHEYRMKRQQTPKWNHFRSYFGNTDIHKQINPKEQNKWTITFLATFVAAVFLPFCLYSSFSHILQSAHQDETNTFSMILLMHSIIFRINAVKYEVCNKIFIDNHYRLMQTIKTTTKNQQQKKTTTRDRHTERVIRFIWCNRVSVINHNDWDKKAIKTPFNRIFSSCYLASVPLSPQAILLKNSHNKWIIAKIRIFSII